MAAGSASDAAIVSDPSVFATVGSLTESSRYLEDYVAFTSVLPELDQARPTGRPPSAFHRLSVRDIVFTYPTSTEPARVALAVADT